MKLFTQKDTAPIALEKSRDDNARIVRGGAHGTLQRVVRARDFDGHVRAAMVSQCFDSLRGIERVGIECIFRAQFLHERETPRHCIYCNDRGAIQTRELRHRKPHHALSKNRHLLADVNVRIEYDVQRNRAHMRKNSTARIERCIQHARRRP